MRPISRPSKPYTIVEVYNLAYEHFITQGNPRCVNEYGSCKYSNEGKATGCFVGFLLTKEDAELFDTIGPLVFIYNTKAYRSYFGDDKMMLRFLQVGQKIHDSYRPEIWKGMFVEYMSFQFNILQVLIGII